MIVTKKSLESIPEKQVRETQVKKKCVVSPRLSDINI